jgi:predicted GNAT family N-acyltransferase
MTDLAMLEVPVFSLLGNEAFRLRRRVFIEEQQIPENEEFEPVDLTATHFVAVSGGEVCGTLRVIVESAHVRIGRVAVAREARGRGVAGRMIAFAMAHYREAAGGRFYLSAQADKVGLYEKFGFSAYGEAYLDGGIPHLSMKTY